MKKFALAVITIIAVLIIIGGGWLIYSFRLIRVPTGAMSNTIVPGDRIIVKRLAGPIRRGDILVFKYPINPSMEFVKRVIGMPGDKIEIRGPEIYINGKLLPEKQVWTNPQVNPKEMLEASSAKRASIPSEDQYKGFYADQPFKKYTAYYWLMGFSSELPEPPDQDTLMSGHRAAQLMPCSFKDKSQYGGLESQVFGVAWPCIVEPDQFFMLGDNRDNSQDSRYWGTVPRELITGRPILIYYSSEKDPKTGKEKVRQDRLYTSIE